MSSPRGQLFGADVPSGFQYVPDFIPVEDEARLADEIGRVEFSNFEMRGVVAKRRVAFFGSSYDSHTVTLPLPPFLLPLRDKVGAWTGVDAQAFAMALINEYSPGAPIGWHRDAPQYDIVAGVSLLSSCQMKFRPYISPGEARRLKEGARRMATHEITLARRSAYVMTAESRHGYEHHIPAVASLRYSITFRTVRA